MNVKELVDKLINCNGFIPVGIEWDGGNACFEIDPSKLIQIAREQDALLAA